jgi:simple sugar transport system ATP-binding protein
MVKTKNSPLIKVEKINKWFGSIQALYDIDLEVYAGETVGLVGDNGAGKSTLIKILAGVYPEDSGKVFWKGNEVKIRSVKDSRKLGIETVFQEQSLVDCFSVGENIFLSREPLKTIIGGVIKIVDYKRIFEESQKALKKLGLNIPVRKEVDFCSGGEQQGVIIARAMYFESELVILDEPERALSIAAKKAVQNFVNRLKEEDIACIYITHDYHQVYPIADRIVLISQGKKVLDVPKADVPLRKIESYILSHSIAFEETSISDYQHL